MSGPEDPARNKRSGRRPRRGVRASSSSSSTKTTELHEVISDSQRRLDFPELLTCVSGFASSRPGKQLLLALIPDRDLSSALVQMEETAEVSKRMGEPSWQLGLEGLVDLPSILPESGGVVLAGSMLNSVWQVIDRSRRLKSILQSQSTPRMSARANLLVDVPGLRERLEKSVDSSGEIRDDASTNLARLRSESSSFDAEIRKWFTDNSEKAPWKKALQGHVVTPRHGRFCWAIRTECRNQVRGVVRGESSSGQTLFIEPEPVIRLGDRSQRARAAEQQEIHRILAELTQEIRSKRGLIFQLWHQLVQMDAIQGKARFARELGCVIPELVDGRLIDLKEARHPLLLWRERQALQGSTFDLESARSSVVPMTLEMNPGRYQVVVTGPNTGGKTLVLKTVGLLSLMAGCGIPVPAADGTRIPIFDSVLADIGDEQSLEQDLSTFSAHVTVVASILRHSTSRSLVLLDELGSGTDPLEGAPLAEAVLDRLYERGTFTLVTTHLGRLKEYAYRRRKCENASMEFDPEKLAPTYRVVVGLPGRSNALVIAERIGMPADVVERAREGSREQDGVDPGVIDAMQRAQKELERRVKEAEKHRQEALRHRQESLQQEQEAQRTRGALEYQLERIEEQKVIAMVAQIRRSLDLLGDLPGTKGEALQGVYRALETALERTDLAKRRLNTARSLSKGDAVFIPRFQQVCEVRKINKEKQRLVVVINGVVTDVAFEDISWVLPPPGFQMWWKCDEGVD
ncbi:MAG: hypothetical protein OSB09_06780, partial [Planctomycetota bacterium]|nr:hypothetical protein [Planctomycetota bacterium]